MFQQLIGAGHEAMNDFLGPMPAAGGSAGKPAFSAVPTSYAPVARLHSAFMLYRVGGGKRAWRLLIAYSFVPNDESSSLTPIAAGWATSSTATECSMARAPDTNSMAYSSPAGTHSHAVHAASYIPP